MDAKKLSASALSQHWPVLPWDRVTAWLAASSAKAVDVYLNERRRRGVFPTLPMIGHPSGGEPLMMDVRQSGSGPHRVFALNGRSFAYCGTNGPNAWQMGTSALKLRLSRIGLGGGGRMTTPFVGRARELAALTTDLDAAVSGRGRVVLVAGEPGIGKTRLAEELAPRATARGAAVLWGRCWEGAGAPAFWPWVQIVRRYVQVQAGDPTSLRHDLGFGAAEIAQLVPAVHDCVPDLPTPPPLEPEAARFRLFDSLTGFLRTAAARRPLLLLLDDLHWADVPSLALLRFMSRELEGTGPLVVGSYRQSEVGQGHPLLAAVADLTRGQHRWLLLGGLGQRDVASFVALVAGGEPSAELAAEVYRQTDGNPFFVTEVVQLLASQGRLDPAARGAAVLGRGLPEGVRAVVAERLGHLSDDCRRILEVAAVVGRDFELRVLQPASGLDTERLLVLLEEAEAGRVVGAVPDGLSRWRFAHALVREVLYEGLRAARRVHLHRLVGEALEVVYAADPGPHLAELAHHLVEAAPGSEETAAKAVQMATLAGRRALEVLAWEDAAELFERALAALELLLAVGEAGWQPATFPPPASPTSRPGSWPGESARPRRSPAPAWAWGRSSPAGSSTQPRSGC